MNKIAQQGLLNAVCVSVYVAGVATLMANGEKIFGDGDKGIVGPISFLMLFVLSATVTGSLVLGKPFLMYLDGKKSEAARLFLYTLGWLALLTGIFLAANVLLTRVQV